MDEARRRMFVVTLKFRLRPTHSTASQSRNASMLHGVSTIRTSLLSTRKDNL